MRLQNRYQNFFVAASGFALMAMANPTFAAGGEMAPSKGAIPSEQPTKPWPMRVRGATCTATGTWTDAFGNGAGTFTRSANQGCHPHGDWRDTFGYSWRFHETGKGQLEGKVNYHGIPNCTAQIWPVTGTYDGKTFVVTATDPVSDSCSSFFTYSMTIQ